MYQNKLNKEYTLRDGQTKVIIIDNSKSTQVIVKALNGERKGEEFTVQEHHILF